MKKLGPKKRWIAFTLLVASFGLLAGGAIAFYQFHQDEQDSRHTLDQLLRQGHPENELAQPSSEEDTAFDRMLAQAQTLDRSLQQLGKIGNGLSTAFQMPSVDLKETEKTYEIRIPVSRPEDAQNIQLQVDPFHIQVAGQFTVQPAGQTGFSASSSFMKSFPTTQELSPHQVTRSLQGNVLLITIPKKVGGASPSVSPQRRSVPTSPSKQLPRDLQEQLRRPQTYI